MEIREREKFMVCLHIFPAVYSWKSDSLPAWYSFVPATPLHLNYQNIPQRPTWIDDPKQYLNYVQLTTKLHSLVPLIRISKLSGNVNYHHYEAQCSLPCQCCPQYIIPPAEGSLIYRVQPEHPGGAAGSELGRAGRRGPGSPRAAEGGEPALWLAGDSGDKEEAAAPKRGTECGISTGHLLYRAGTRLCSTHYLLIVYFWF